MIKLLIPALLFQLSLAKFSPDEPLQCKNQRSKICWLQSVSFVGIDPPTLPNLSGKHTLHIRSGNIPHFSEQITSQLGDVTKVTLGRLNIESIHIPSNWVSLNAESNRIRKLIVESSDDAISTEYMADEPVDDADDSPPLETPTVVKSEKVVETTPLDSTTPKTKEVDKDDSPTTATTTSQPEEPTVVEPGETSTEATTEKEKAVETTTTTTARTTTTTTTEEPPRTGHQLQSLNLANNKLRSIRELKGMVNLRELHLDGNELEFLEMTSFKGMTRLRKLSLAKNKINLISSPDWMELPSLEWLSLAFNKLDTLHVSKWNMLQLVELDLSHNNLIKLDVENFDQFVSLEKLGLANNSWTCYWLNQALKKISSTDFITLVDRDDDPGNCPNGLPVQGICCSLTIHDSDESNYENLHDRIEHFQKEHDRMDEDLNEKLHSYAKEWDAQWNAVNQNLTERKKQIEAVAKLPKDDTKVTEKDIKELKQLIADCQPLLANLRSLREENAAFASSFTESIYKTINLKNKLLAAMRRSVQLKDDLNRYESSFNADRH